MNCLIVASTERYAGKTGIAAALLVEARERGVRAAYFKPFGAMPLEEDGVTTDRDAAYVSELAAVKAAPEVVCPVVRTRALVESALAGDVPDLVPRVSAAYAKVADGADVVFVEGPSDLAEGLAFGLDLRRLADLLCGRVLLVDRPGSSELPEHVLFAHDLLGEALLGVVFNDVAEARFATLERAIRPYFARAGVPVLGSILHDPRLSSVTVAEIVEALDGTALTAEGALDAPVETFIIGAMGQEKALRYFRRKAHKAVVTGGDRSDIQLAALETDTRCIICTGGMQPTSIVMSRAEDLGVPMVLVGMDTLSAVERMETLFGRVRVHDSEKVGRIREMLSAAVDLDALFETLR